MKIIFTINLANISNVQCAICLYFLFMLLSFFVKKLRQCIRWNPNCGTQLWKLSKITRPRLHHFKLHIPSVMFHNLQMEKVSSYKKNLGRKLFLHIKYRVNIFAIKIHIKPIMNYYKEKNGFSSAHKF